MMRFDITKAMAMITVARMAAGAASGGAAPAAQAAAVAGGAGVYNRKTATRFQRVAGFSALVAAMKFASAPALAALPGCIALFMATFLVMVGFAVVLRQHPLGTDLLSSAIVTVLYGIGAGAVACAFGMAVGHPLDAPLWAVAAKVAADCGCYLLICWVCDKILFRCHRL